jgi:hypothetical protein
MEIRTTRSWFCREFAHYNSEIIIGIIYLLTPAKKVEILRYVMMSYFFFFSFISGVGLYAMIDYSKIVNLVIHHICSYASSDTDPVFALRV